ncbi:MAG: 4-(cytidine 5'-diphospho)-2-C-methyl-D-erythritol kinase [Pseudomonadota bacterium]
MSVHWFPCPGKINLFLHINGRLESGYHQLQTYFQLLDYSDELGIKITDDNLLAMSSPIDGVKDCDNLIIQAATALKAYTDSSKGAIFTIKKQLPMGGGLGGGSSNAASTLVALNKLWHTHLSTEQLMTLGKSLGADVPVFILGKSGFANGIGEVITPARLPQKWYLIANPNLHVSTAEVFSADDLPRDTPLITFDEFRFNDTINDCQTFVCNRYPEVANLIQWLLNYAPARMTGTGACVFAVFDTQEKAKIVLDLLPEKYAGFICRGTHESALHAEL